MPVDRYKFVAEDGEWVMLEDHEAEVARLEAEVERLQAIADAATSLTHTARQNMDTLANRGHTSAAFQAAGDQWHAAYNDLKAALAQRQELQ